MPKKEIVIRCECGGELKFLASTQFDGSLRAGDSKNKTKYYQCDSCGKVFQQLVGHICGSPDSDYESHFSEYCGLLTPEELKKHVGECLGGVYERHEKKILALRDGERE